MFFLLDAITSPETKGIRYSLFVFVFILEKNMEWGENVESFPKHF